MVSYLNPKWVYKFGALCLSPVKFIIQVFYLINNYLYLKKIMSVFYYRTWLAPIFVARGGGDGSGKQNPTIKKSRRYFSYHSYLFQGVTIFTSVLGRSIQTDQLGKLLAVVLLTADFLRNCCPQTMYQYIVFLLRQCIDNSSTKCKDLSQLHFLEISMHF